MFNSPFTIETAVPAIYKRAQKRAWSLAELQLNAKDYDSLCRWMSIINRGTLIEWFNTKSLYKCEIKGGQRKFSSYAVIGILLLLFSAEIVRREGRGRNLWSVVKNKFSQDTQDFLFPRGQPCPALKKAIERAAKEFNLRHLFGIEGLHNWFDTIYLQIGFTHHGFTTQLPEWLCGAEPLAMQYLLGKKGNIPSDSFKELWTLLKSFREQKITEQKLRQDLKQDLKQNDWILSEWIDDLIVCARAKIHLSEKTSEIELIESKSSACFLSQPILQWKEPSDRPQFICKIQNLADLDLSEPDYDILVNSKFTERLIRQEDGSYSCENEIVLLNPTAEMNAVLVDENKQVIQSLLLQLWNLDENLTIFDLQNGERLSSIEKTMSMDKSYALLATSDLTVQPNIEQYYGGFKGIKLLYLPKNWSADLQIPEIFWKPQLSDIKSKDLNGKIKVSPSKRNIKLGEVIKLDLKKTEENIEILSIRAAGKPVHLDTCELRITPDLITNFDTETQSGRVKLKIKLKTGQEQGTVNKELSLKVKGVTYLTNDGNWEILTPNTILAVEQAKYNLFKVFGVSHHQDDQWQDCFLFEGNIPIKGLWQRPQPLGTLAGLGEKLSIHRNYYNNSPEGELLILAHEVLDKGVIQDIEIKYNILYLELVNTIEPDEKYRILWWDATGKIDWLEVDNYEIEQEFYRWEVILPQILSKPLVIAVGYAGQCLGTWYDSDWVKLLENPQEPEKIACLIRWSKLPILSESYFPLVQKFAYQYPEVIFKQWIFSKTSFMESLNWDTSYQENWYSAIRKIFLDFQPSVGLTTDLIIQPQNSQDFVDWLLSDSEFHILCEIDPILMAKFLMKWSEKMNNTHKKQLIRFLLNKYENESNLQETCKEMQVDANFLERLFHCAITRFKKLTAVKCQYNQCHLRQSDHCSFNEANLAVALGNSNSFRNLLTTNILKTVLEEQ